jgi:hypothetical protein
MAAAAATTPLRNPVPDPIDALLAPYHFPLELSGIVNEYVMRRPECFGGAEWRKYLGVDVGNPVLPDEFVSWWSRSDAVDILDERPNPRSNYETHLDPIWRPQFINEARPYDLETLTRLAAAPRNGGHPMTIEQGAEAFTQHARTPAGPGCWLVFRRDVVARNQTYEEQKGYMDRLNGATGAGYERDNALLDLATVVAVRHVYKGERHLGDSTGMEGRVTYARSRDLVLFDDRSYPSAIGGFAPSRVSVYCGYGYGFECDGVAALRKFEGS